ncbi:protein SREK1IP1-like [Toxorhynchites rutilus septentrionalis]|uniref:protein SREK1IP1-like n=1 Tax=Toxorhynchites rutilus septentrionalis TaxID=329112 RepID=UPI00247975D6|nr:protein SREK1IP1-like [Toxorhynchites rutilus septentrionalis]
MEFLLGGNQKDTVRSACKKCGYAGHLTYQCRNYLKIDKNQTIVTGNNRSGSESPEWNYLTPLQELRRQEEHQEKTQAEKHDNKHKDAAKSSRRSSKRKRSRSRSSSSDDDLDRDKHKNQKSKKKKKSKKSS